VSVQAASTRVNDETYPLGSIVTYQFPAPRCAAQATNRHIAGQTGAAAGEVEMPACKTRLYDGGLRPPRPDGLPEGRKMGDNGRLLIGDKGFILGGARARKTAYFQRTALRTPLSSAKHPAFRKALSGMDRGLQRRPSLVARTSIRRTARRVSPAGNVALRVQLREELTL